jgi:hypothetical protein
MEGFIVKAKTGETYLTHDGDTFKWDDSKHAFVNAHVFTSEEQADAVAETFGGRVLYLD